MNRLGSGVTGIGAALVATGALLAGCGSSESATVYNANLAVPRCEATPQVYPQPLPPSPEPILKAPAADASTTDWDNYLANSKKLDDEYAAAGKAYEDAISPPILTEPVHHGVVDGGPIGPDETMVSHVELALTQIKAPDWKASGFVTTLENKHGQQVVVTAAHAIGTLTLNEITIVSGDGSTVHPTGGCYLYENEGTFANLPAGPDANDKPKDTDVAVLTLPHNISQAPLQFAKATPKAGDWLNFINYQYDYAPASADGAAENNPATYNGIMTPTPGFVHTFDVITGAYDPDPGQPMTVGDWQSIHAGSGASGSPVEDANGQVVGLVADGTKDGHYLDPDFLRSAEDIAFPGADNGPHTNFQPTAATLMPASLIERAEQDAAKTGK